MATARESRLSERWLGFEGRERGLGTNARLKGEASRASDSLRLGWAESWARSNAWAMMHEA